jgi:hypothetical protein
MGRVRDSRQPVMTWTEEGIVAVRYQATTSEDIEDLVCAVVRIWVREKSSINPTTTPNPMSGHKHVRIFIFT